MSGSLHDSLDAEEDRLFTQLNEVLAVSDTRAATLECRMAELDEAIADFEAAQRDVAMAEKQEIIAGFEFAASAHILAAPVQDRAVAMRRALDEAEAEAEAEAERKEHNAKLIVGVSVWVYSDFGSDAYPRGADIVGFQDEEYRIVEFWSLFPDKEIVKVDMRLLRIADHTFPQNFGSP